MADLKNNEAYDLSIFESRVSTAAPEKKNKKTPIKPKVVREKPKTKQQLRAEAADRKRTLLKLTVVCSVLFILFAAVLQSRVTILTNAAEQAKQEVTLKAAESEGVRLKAELDSKFSLNNVEAYAKKAGMQKIERYQIYYVNPLKGDEIISYIGKPAK